MLSPFSSLHIASHIQPFVCLCVICRFRNTRNSRIKLFRTKYIARARAENIDDKLPKNSWSGVSSETYSKSCVTSLTYGSHQSPGVILSFFLFLSPRSHSLPSFCPSLGPLSIRFPISSALSLPRYSHSFAVSVRSLPSSPPFAPCPSSALPFRSPLRHSEARASQRTVHLASCKSVRVTYSICQPTCESPSFCDQRVP